eukprot:3585931-Pyramimonas_sp.AAC.1
MAACQVRWHRVSFIQDIIKDARCKLECLSQDTPPVFALETGIHRLLWVARARACERHHFSQPLNVMMDYFELVLPQPILFQSLPDRPTCSRVPVVPSAPTIPMRQ